MDTYLRSEQDDEADPFAEDGPLDRLGAACRQAGVPVPPIPEAFLALIEEVAEGVFTTQRDLDTLMGLGALIDAAAEGDLSPGFGFGIEGQGANGWALRYFAVSPTLALFIEVPFGGAYMDGEAARLDVSAALAGAARLLAATDPRSEEVFVVHHRGVRGSRYCTPGTGAPAWHDVPDAMLAVENALSPGEAATV